MSSSPANSISSNLINKWQCCCRELHRHIDGLHQEANENDQHYLKIVQALQQQIKEVKQIKTEVEELRTSYQSSWVGPQRGERTVRWLGALSGLGIIASCSAESISFYDTSIDIQKRIAGIVTTVVTHTLCIITGVTAFYKDKAEKEMNRLSEISVEELKQIRNIREFLKNLKLLIQTQQIQHFNKCLEILKNFPPSIMHKLSAQHAKQHPGLPSPEQLFSMLLKMVPHQTPITEQVEKIYRIAKKLEASFGANSSTNSSDNSDQASSLINFDHSNGKAEGSQEIYVALPSAKATANNPKEVAKIEHVALDLLEPNKKQEAAPEQQHSEAEVKTRNEETASAAASAIATAPKDDVAPPDQLKRSVSESEERPSEHEDIESIHEDYSREWGALISKAKVPIKFVVWRGKRLHLHYHYEPNSL